MAMSLPRIFMGTRQPLIGISRNGLRCSVPGLMGSGPISGTFSIVNRLPNVRGSKSGISVVKAPSASVLVGKHGDSVATRRLTNLLGSASSSGMGRVSIVCDAPPQFNIGNTSVGIMVRGSGSLGSILGKRVSLANGRNCFFSPSNRTGLSCVKGGCSTSVSCSTTCSRKHRRRRVVTQPAMGSHPCSVERSS